MSKQPFYRSRFVRYRQPWLLLFFSLLLSSFSWGNESHWVNVTLQSRFEDFISAHPEVIAPVYLDNDFKYIWIDASGQPSAAALALINLVKPFTLLSEQHPLTAPYRKFLALQAQPLTLALPRYLLATDLLYSDMFARLQHDIQSGLFIQADQDNDHQEYRYGIPAAEPIIEQKKPWQEITLEQLRLAAALPEEQRNSLLTRGIKQLYPTSEQKEPLLAAIDFWLQRKKEGAWPALPYGEKMLPGMIRPDWIPPLISQLQRLQLLAQDYQPELQDRYDDQLVSAVKKIQAQHGQLVDGIIGPRTRRVLNLSPDYRIRQLAHNFRRLYHLPEQLGERYMMINMANYSLDLIEYEQSSMSMRVIIGTPDARTPIMTQTLTSVILSPRWNIPKSIGYKSIFPKAQKNPSYLQDREIMVVEGWNEPAQEVPTEQIDFNAYSSPEAFPYRFVQLPGQHNQLGYVKFRLSNKKAIYMHDTPGKHLFERRDRALSNGCVRLEDALPLVDKLLAAKPYGWDEEKVQEVLRSKEERYIRMTPALPVYLMYWTVWADKSGQLQWRDDIYHKDQLPNPQPEDTLLAAKPIQSRSDG
ncbi:Putative peptidoglycan binding domain-containing protein [Oceanospirillum multiglobuliferum]|uniref:L,D-TPase catalytic domain-containing protein n=1 Tax=Oceanospirillum multiglobuliferum TaxID=64969 RepID=A0A1T4SHE4_9GAMM|nr:L,D-transpeptidase family protein [Oceanospirillum multiglobuliferum]OPX54266.1 hypothetical protein BTE48_15130 [Oceanospirillum multiglobuliferum]SKA27231.1 Putative peptidoglycan binding domain-containing protein [Oceanospirillum multiglobuliferum]